jgi:hypothetical protein
MSVTPNIPPGAPSLAEVLLKRTFARPPEPFVDGDLMKAFGHVADPPEAAAPPPGDAGVDVRA